MTKRRKNKSNRTKRKSKKSGRKSGRAVNFMGALLLEICGMILLLTLFFTFRESPAEFEARMKESEKTQVEYVQQNERAEPYVVGLFEGRR